MCRFVRNTPKGTALDFEHVDIGARPVDGPDEGELTTIGRPPDRAHRISEGQEDTFDDQLELARAGRACTAGPDRRVGREATSQTLGLRAQVIVDPGPQQRYAACFAAAGQVP